MKSRLALLVAGLCLLTGCAPTPPLQQTIKAGSSAEFQQWRANSADTLAAGQWRWFDIAIQELKLGVMRAGKISGSVAIEASVREHIHGRPLGDVLREGLQAYLERKTAERHDTETTIATNDQRIKPLIKPGADDILRDFNAHQEMLREKLPRLDSDIAEARAALANFGL